jgi:hypothetical protein
MFNFGRRLNNQRDNQQAVKRPRTDSNVINNGKKINF